MKYSKLKLYANWSFTDGTQFVTNAINLAAEFTNKGNRVLVIDCDSSRNLTLALLKHQVDAVVEKIISANQTNEIEHLVPSPLTDLINRKIKNNCHRTLYDQVMDTGPIIKPVESFNINRNTWLVPAHQDMILLEHVILRSEMLNAPVLSYFSLDRSNDMTGKIYASIIKTAEKYKIDYVLLFLGRGNVFNRCLIFSSHFYIILTDANLRGLEHINYAYDNLKQWYLETKRVGENMLLSDYPINFPLPILHPIFLGLILGVSGRINVDAVFYEAIVLVTNQTESIMTLSSEKFFINQIKKGVDKLTSLKLTDFSI